MKRHLCLALAGAVVILTTGCELRELQPFDQRYSSPVQATGRLMVWPQPIVVPWRPSNPYGSQYCACLAVTNVGSEPVIVDDITVDDSSSLGLWWTFWGDPAVDTPFHFPLEITGGIGFSVCLAPDAAEQRNGTLTLHTQDPTSPTVRVPIVLDADAESTLDCISSWGQLTPNPIRLSDVAVGDTVEMNFQEHRANMTGKVTSVILDDPDLEIEQFYILNPERKSVSLPFRVDSQHDPDLLFTLRRTSITPGAPTGTLTFTFDPDGMVPYTIVVPIVH